MDTDEELERLKLISELSGLLILIVNSMGLDYLGVYEGILKLEELYGTLPIFHIPEYYPSERRKEIIKYRLKEQLDIKRIFSGMKDIFAISEPTNVITEYIMKFLKPDFNNHVKNYLSYFELIHENVIIPLIEKASESQVTGYNQQIDYVRTLFRQHEECKQLSFLLDGINGTLRNALVHSNYYVKEGILHYYQDYPWQRKVLFFEKSIEEFEKEAGRLFIQRWIFNIISGLRRQKLSLQELKQLSKRRKSRPSRS